MVLSGEAEHGGLSSKAKRIGLSGVETSFMRDRAGRDEAAYGEDEDEVACCDLFCKGLSCADVGARLLWESERD